MSGDEGNTPVFLTACRCGEVNEETGLQCFATEGHEEGHDFKGNSFTRMLWNEGEL
jgi:hypothetical protein